MPLSAYALASVEELKNVLSIDIGLPGQDSILESILNRASEAIETYLGRSVITRGSVTEYHTVEASTRLVLALQFPITTITSVSEGYWSSGTWTASATLVQGQDYLCDLGKGTFRRLSSYWRTGDDGVKLVYSAGYTQSTVPGPIKDVCLQLAARKFSQIRRGGDFTAQTITDAVGSVSRFLPSELLNMEKEGLYSWRRHDIAPTGRSV